jgi:hypothetical protein
VKSRIIDVQEDASGGGVQSQGKDLSLEGAYKDKGKDHERMYSDIEELWQIAQERDLPTLDFPCFAELNREMNEVRPELSEEEPQDILRMATLQTRWILWSSPELSSQNDLLQERDKISQQCLCRTPLSHTLNSFADIVCDM